MFVEEHILELLSCPECSSSLKNHPPGLLCECCKKIYPIEDEIIILLPEKSVTYEGKNGNEK